MESVTQEKKKLRSVVCCPVDHLSSVSHQQSNTLFQISFEAQAPPGYTFIPAGNPQLTNACKELCRKDGLKVFAVTVCFLQPVREFL